MGRNPEWKKWEGGKKRREAQGKIEEHSGICREREIQKNREIERKRGGVLVAFNSRNSETGFRFLAGCLWRC